MPKIIIAKNAGFCPGVKSAIDLVIELSKKNQKKIYTLGPLIHNKDVIKSLEEKNIFAIENLDEIKEENAILVIRAHGITPELEKYIRNKKLQIIDGTCPLVKNVHRLIEKYSSQGYWTVILGDKDHAEVIGLKGYAGEKSFIINSIEEAQKLPEMDNIHLVSQTTQEEELFYKVANLMKNKTKNLIISNTICNPTKLRQRETYEFSKNADLVIVVGGKHSANTQRLFKICSKLAKSAILIERPEELNEKIISGKENIFITAGASTPNWLIESVFEKTQKLLKSEKEKFTEFLNILWKTFINSGIYTGISAAFLTLISSQILGSNIIPKKILLTSTLFVLSLHVLNRAAEKNEVEADEIKKIIFIKFANTIKTIAYISGIFSLLISATINQKIFISISFIWLIGIIYPYTISKHFHKINGSKDIILSLGWTFACSILPIFWLKEKLTEEILLIIIFIFILVFIRSILLSISQAHNDMIVGKENIYKVLGSKKTEFLLYFLSLFTIIIFFYISHLNKNHFTTFISLFYYPLIIYIFNKNKIPDKTNSEALIDFQFILTGALFLI